MVEHEYKYVMVSPAGNEHPTDDDVYRYRLLAQGYTEMDRDVQEEIPQMQSGQPETGESDTAEPTEAPPAPDASSSPRARARSDRAV